MQAAASGYIFCYVALFGSYEISFFVVVQYIDWMYISYVLFDFHVPQ